VEIVKSRAECINCRWKKRGGRITMEVEAIKHQQRTHHKVAIHHLDMSIYMSDERTVALVIGKAIKPEPPDGRLF
jgi:hypothetical protein